MHNHEYHDNREFGSVYLYWSAEGRVDFICYNAAYTAYSTMLIGIDVNN